MASPKNDEDLTYLDGETIISLSKRNLQRLSGGTNKITRQNLLDVSTKMLEFTADEHELNRLLLRFFGIISEMAGCDEEGEQTISENDIFVLEQFLVQTRLTLKELNEQCLLISHVESEPS